jgi:hypothetical protein
MNMRNLFPAQSFADWYANLANQGAHGGVVGVGLALLASAILPAVAAWFVVVMVYGAFETVQAATAGDGWQISWGLPDSLADLAHVSGGAAVLICALNWGLVAAALAFGMWCALLALETWRRVK